MFTGVMSWMIGSTNAPPLITTFSPKQAGADERDLLGRAAVQPVHQVDDDRDDDDRDDQPEYQRADELPRHRPFLPTRNVHTPAWPQPRPMRLNFLVCSVSATSTGNRSIEEAP